MRNLARVYQSRSQTVSGSLLLATVALLIAASALAGATISARYTQPRGTHITWEIKIPTPLPAVVIVTQYIPPGTDIVSSSHPVSSYDMDAGVAKFLLTPVSQGVLRMEMEISRPIRKKGEIRGEIMFKDQSQNTIASVFMKPMTTKKALEGC